MNHKKLLAAALSCTVVASACLMPAHALNYGEEWQGSSSGYTRQYTDVPPTYWAYENIQRVSAKNWFNGYPDGSFHPLGEITRSEAMKVFVVFCGLELQPVTESSYYDVSESAWYAPYVEAGKGLLPTRFSMQGKVPFQPEMPITREDAMYALVKALGYDDEVQFVDESVLNMFKDQSSLSSNVRPYIAFAVSKGLVSGRADGTIGGQDALSRAEFATILYRGSEFGFKDSHEPKLRSVAVSPSIRQELTVGDSVTFSGIATYSDGSTDSYKNLNPYNADNNGVVSINKNTVTAEEPGLCTIQFNDENLKDTAVVINVKPLSGSVSLKLDSYESSTEEKYVTLSGTARDSAGGELTLTCNGRPVAVNSSGSFSQIFELDLGQNDFEFTVTNEAGNTASRTITITRLEPEPPVVPETPTQTPDATLGSFPDDGLETTPYEEMDDSSLGEPVG